MTRNIDHPPPQHSKIAVRLIEDSLIFITIICLNMAGLSGGLTLALFFIQITLWTCRDTSHAKTLKTFGFGTLRIATPFLVKLEEQEQAFLSALTHPTNNRSDALQKLYRRTMLLMEKVAIFVTYAVAAWPYREPIPGFLASACLMTVAIARISYWADILNWHRRHHSSRP